MCVLRNLNVWGNFASRSIFIKGYKYLCISMVEFVVSGSYKFNMRKKSACETKTDEV